MYLSSDFRSAILIVILLAAANTIAHFIPAKTPPYFSNPAPLTSHSAFDLSSVVGGFRKFGADIAWIQLLQYLGTTPGVILTPEESFLIEMRSAKNILGINLIDEKKAAMLKYRTSRPDYEGDPEKHKELLNYALRVVRLDPYFQFVYAFSAAALAWNYNRVEEALSLLEEGIRNNPECWQFHLYVSAIIYKKNLMHNEMLLELEKALKHTDAPNMLKAIVANIYEKDARYLDALKLWIEIVETKDAMYYEKGLKKIEKLSEILGIKIN